jgi:hypothetical protein
MVRWASIFAVLAIAALFINGQCYALCFASLCKQAVAQDSAGCHQSSHQQHNETQDCPHRHANLVSAEVTPDLVKAQAAYVHVSPCLMPVPERAPYSERFSRIGNALEQRGSPPGTPLFLSLSVLRI